MGGPKALLVHDGETLLQRTSRIAREAGCDPVIAVVGDWDPGTLGPSVLVVRNPMAREGMASSLRRGIETLPRSARAALVLTIDQPAVDVPLLRRLMEANAADPDRPAACAYAGSLGVPAILPSRLFHELLRLEGDRGAKAILLREDATALPFPEGGLDLDTPEDLERLRR